MIKQTAMINIKTKLSVTSALIAMLLIIGCSEDEKEEMENPEMESPESSFSGSLSNSSGENIDFSASVITASFDTVNGRLLVSAINDAGAEIKILLSDSSTGFYSFSSQAANSSTYQTTGLPNPSSTKPNDPGLQQVNTGSVQLTDFQTSTSPMTVTGTIDMLSWYELNPGVGNDDLYSSLQAGIFENVPVTLVGNIENIGGDGGPAEPELNGTFIGELISASNGEEIEFVASLITAEYDTTANILTLSAEDADGIQVEMELHGELTENTAYSYNFANQSLNIATLIALDGETFTTQANMDDTNGTIIIDSYNQADVTVSGFGSLLFYEVVSNGEDQLQFVLQDIEFSDVQVTKTG
jgi:hypothetical protein